MSPRKRPYPLKYRRALLALAGFLDRTATRLRAHVLRHTPHRRRLTAAEIVDTAMRRIGSG